MRTTDIKPVVVRIVLDGDTSIVYDELSTLAWIQRIDRIREGERSIWTVFLQGPQPGPTDLLRVVLADRRLRLVEFSLLTPTEEGGTIST